MKPHTAETCSQTRKAIFDALEIISGKWKLIILTALMNRSFRFKELCREIGITPRMLSKELQEMEQNQLVTRTVLDTRPVSVEYAITRHGRTFGPVLDALCEWGTKHRNKIIRGMEVA